jgi:lipoic acid synthetase
MTPKPPWLRVKLPGGPDFLRMQSLVRNSRLHTVCQEALCPNQGRCWERNHATFLILGDRCTRGCAFCNVTARKPHPPDPDEPRRVAEAIRTLGVREIVLTSVTRDDLPDGGAAAWVATVLAVRQAIPEATIEVLVPDFSGNPVAQDRVIAARPDVFGHNLETVPSLYPKVRPSADYRRSLDLLARAHDAGLTAKTALMLGLGETPDEVTAVMRDARAAGCDILFLGQYLRPSREHCPVVRYVTPEEFDTLGRSALGMGFAVVESAPLVRSSYHSDAQSAFVASRRPHM